MELFQRCLKLQKASLGQDHPHTVATMSQIAGIYRRTVRAHQALPLMRRAQLGDEHPETLSALNARAATLEQLGKYPEAITLHQEVLERTESLWGPDHPQTTNARNALGLAWFANELDKAEQLGRRSLEIATRSHPDHWQTFDTRVLLGRILLAKGLTEEAQAMLKEGWDGLEKRRPTMIGEELSRIDAAKEALERISSNKVPHVEPPDR
jgi:tetratricopeptide (TPR) repeat protein